ncbi:hypothetical protein BZG36_02994 [Bifiguratus adelaidae]|uniref:C2H2-type domain-containing protein n=1 Tax=Bifiguratus adelaidae TaxID=1938954 RepID=A0A261XYD4_9FUNG|nr:hypothetical protein BZG36_02994 [Bifiguratus adelaidae]
MSELACMQLFMEGCGDILPCSVDSTYPLYLPSYGTPYDRPSFDLSRDLVTTPFNSTDSEVSSAAEEDEVMTPGAGPYLDFSFSRRRETSFSQRPIPIPRPGPAPLPLDASSLLLTQPLHLETASAPPSVASVPVLDPPTPPSLVSTTKPYSCLVSSCTKSFSREANLKNHAQSHHSPSKPFACTLCSRAFARKHDLQRHVRVHTGHKPYICSGCSKGFARSDALGRHWKVDRECEAEAAKGRPLRRKLVDLLLT